MSNLRKTGETPFSLEGFYILVGSQLTKQQQQNNSQPFKLLLRERANPTGKKAKIFLSALIGKRHLYISSLYSHSATAYKLEYKGVEYLLSQKSSTEYVISKRGGANA